MLKPPKMGCLAPFSTGDSDVATKPSTLSLISHKNHDVPFFSAQNRPFFHRNFLQLSVPFLTASSQSPGVSGELQSHAPNRPGAATGAGEDARRLVSFLAGNLPNHEKVEWI
jgi:hypothetical protein